MIRLYHGSNVDIGKIDLSLCNPNKDFGQGFYLTDIREQAEQMALRRTRIAGQGHPTVSTFEFDESLIDSGCLNVKTFNSPDAEWALFILANRNNSENKPCHRYDIVIGPVADDGVAFQLERYVRNIITLETLTKELTYRKLNRQYFFGTEAAIAKLNKIHDCTTTISY